MFDYKPPIQVIATDLEMKIENGVYSAVQKYGVEVDKDELIKALKYDRDQYDRGYWRGREEAIREFAEKLKHRCRDSVELDDYRVTVVTKSDIDDLVEEMVVDKDV